MATRRWHKSSRQTPSTTAHSHGDQAPSFSNTAQGRTAKRLYLCPLRLHSSPASRPPSPQFVAPRMALRRLASEAWMRHNPPLPGAGSRMTEYNRLTSAYQGRRTAQAQQPGAREATIATATLLPGSLQRMVRRQFHDPNNLLKNDGFSSGAADSQSKCPTTSILRLSAKYKSANAVLRSND